MSLSPSIIEPVADQTVLVAPPAFPKGDLYLSMRDEPGTLSDRAINFLNGKHMQKQGFTGFYG